MKKKIVRNKQRFFAAVLCAAVFAASPVASAAASPVASATASPVASATASPEASASARAAQVVYQEKAALESLPKERVSVPLTPEQDTLLRTQLTQLMEACGGAIERMNPDKASFYMPTEEDFQELRSCAASLGLSVSMEGEKMENRQNVTAFLEAVQRGEDAHVFYVRFNSYNVGCEAFWFEDGRLYSSTGWAEYLDPANHHITDKEQIIDMKLTDEGHLLYANAGDISYLVPPDEKKAGDTGEYRQNYNLLCVHDTDPKAAAYRSKYIDPLSMDPRGCALTTNWNPEYVDRLNWEALFADAYRLETQKNMWKAYPTRKTIIWKPENMPDGVDDRELIVPSEDVEAILEKYYPVTQEQLRRSKFYDEKRDAYIFVKPTLYGTAPADFPEVAAYRENEDGTLTLTVNCISRYNEDAVDFTSKITIQPREDGSYCYLSNWTDFVSEYSKDW